MTFSRENTIEHIKKWGVEYDLLQLSAVYLNSLSDDELQGIFYEYQEKIRTSKVARRSI